jgi:ParB family transcriptional regulator, chromosome partitioning protein
MPAKPAAKRKRASRKAKPKTIGLDAAESRLEESSAAIREVVTRVGNVGGTMIGSFRDPLGGTPLNIAIVPIDSIEPTPFQRDLSEAHHKKLAYVIEKTGVFLDPVISVPAPNGGFWTPNGRHRLEAMRRLGAKAITTLIASDPKLAWQILALNTEKAHNLKERSLEVARIYRGLIEEDGSRLEKEFAFYLDEAALVTLGFCYEKKPVFAGGAYHPILRRLEEFEEEPLKKTVKQHETRADMVLDLEEKVADVVKRLKERGLTSPYLRTFVVARINPLRWIKGELPDVSEVLKTMRERAAKFNVDKVKPQDLASMAGAPPDED